MEQENRMKGLECTRFLARMAGWMGCFDGSGFERRSKLDGSGRDGKFSFGCVGFSLLWGHSVVSNKLLNVIWHLREILDLEIVLRISRKKVVINPQERNVVSKPLADMLFGPGLKGSVFRPAEPYFRHWTWLFNGDCISFCKKFSNRITKTEFNSTWPAFFLLN